MTSTVMPAYTHCPGCHSEIAAALLACPACGRLVHADQVRGLAEQAQAAEQAGDVPRALQAWRDTLTLLPLHAPQRQPIEARMTELSRHLDAGQSGWRGWWQKLRTLGPAGVLVAALSKLKFLLLGLSKLGTLATMALSLWVYAQFWGWRFALGFVILIYIHEMGHVAMLHRYGIRASAPVFLPGLGAFIRMRQYPTEPRENARAGLAGPVWGAAATVVCWWLGRVTHYELWTALAAAGAILNLFNLLPFWQLDGARGFSALARWQRWTVAFAFAAAWYFTGQGLLVLLAAVSAYAALQRPQNPGGDSFTLFEFLALIAVLAPLAVMRALVR